MIRIAILAPPGFAFATQFAAAIRPVIRSRARLPELTFETRRRYNTVKRSSRSRDKFHANSACSLVPADAALFFSRKSARDAHSRRVFQ